MALSNINLVTFCVNAFHLHTETYRESPDPSFPVRDTESDPRWGWLGLACETKPCLGYELHDNISLLQSRSLPHTLFLHTIDRSVQRSCDTFLQPGGEFLQRRTIVVTGEKAHAVAGGFHVLHTLAAFLEHGLLQR